MTSLVAKQQAPRGGTETILVAEHDAIFRQCLIHMLQFLGYGVLDAAGGTEAIEILREHKEKIALLLTNVIMPKMGGKTLADRARAELPAIKVLFVSDDLEDKSMSEKLPNTAFLEKPFLLKELAELVRRLLDT